MEKAMQTDNKMATMPIPRLLISLGAPMMLSMFTQALYNLVDSFFVAHIPDTAAISNMGDKAINALTLAFPVQLFILCIGIGTGVGTGAAIGMFLGCGDRESASKTSGNAIFISVIYYLLTILFGIFGVGAYVRTQTSNPEIAQMATEYLQIICLLSFGSLGYMDLEKKALAIGRAKLSMVGQMTGAITNIIMDPLLIFGLGPFPALGVRGAAYATVIGQFASLFLTGFIYYRDTRYVDHGLSYCVPSARIIARIYKVGFPAAVMSSLNSVMSYVMNLILGTISESAITAFGLYFKLNDFVLMPAIGMANGVVPAISYNYGAHNKKRISDSIKYGIIYVGVIMLIGTVVLVLFAPQVIGLFSLAAESRALSITALKIATLGLVFAAGGMVLSGTCQAFGIGSYSLLITCVRLLIVLLPLAYFLGHMPGGETLIWIAFPVADLASVLLAIVLTRRLYRKKVGDWEDEASESDAVVV